MIELMRDLMLVEPVEDTTAETVGGIILPDTSKRISCRGIVRNVGPKCSIPVGTEVVYNPRLARSHEDFGSQLVMLGEKEVLCGVQ